MGQKIQKYYIGVDIGGTKIVIALIDINGNVLFKKILSTELNLNKNVVIRNISEIIDEIKIIYKDINIIGIGIGSAGIVLYNKGIIKFSPNIGWRDFYIVSQLQKISKMRVVLDNDANAAAWGIFYLKYKSKYNNMLCVTLGTGVGGGFILNGKMFRGIDGTAGEIGHMTYIPDGLECPCGNKGCLERYVGKYGLNMLIDRHLKEEAQKSNLAKKSLLLDYKKENVIVDPKLLEAAAEKGDELALKIWIEFGEILGTAFATILNLLNLEAIHITGGIAHAQKFFEKALVDTIKRRAFSVPAETVKLIFEEKKQDMGVIGAGLLLEEL
ncbi:MAG: ROK family protein [Elusimicrobiota bacterium]|jgi:glucokinase|nr:ROK family protein [Elusimicrobiota bacterium]